jgi:branched-chain amino acid transport system ATP-binding protein
MSILMVQDVTVRFGGLEALKRVTLDVKEGEILGLIGPNGAGKTTLLNVITGVVKPQQGKILYKGKDITGWPPHKIAKLGIARTFQIVRPLPHLTVLENALIGALHGKRNLNSLSEAYKVAKESIEIVGLSGKEKEKALNLNEIEKKRLELARALSTGADLLLLDEVGAGCVYSEIMELNKTINAVRNEYGKTIVLVEHVMKLVMNVSDRIIVLNMGEKIAEGSPQEIIANEKVREVYIGEYTA